MIATSGPNARTEPSSIPTDDTDRAAWPVEPEQINTFEYLGVLVAADTTGWTVAQTADPTVAAGMSWGGPGSYLMVGPGTLTLDDGTIIDVAASTPGGNFCTLLDIQRQLVGTSVEPDACLVVGEFQPGTTIASWFATIPVWPQDTPDWFYVGETSVHDQVALVTAGDNAYITLPIDPDAAANGCFEDLSAVEAERAGRTLGSVISTRTDTVALVECLGTD